jgi:hypothetical protein
MSGDPLKGDAVVYIFKKIRSKVFKENRKRLARVWRRFRNVRRGRRTIRKKNDMRNDWMVFAVLAGAAHPSCERHSPSYELDFIPTP